MNYKDLIGNNKEEVEDFLMHEDLFSDDMVRISETDTDTYYFYKVKGDNEDRCVEVYFNKDNTVTDIEVYTY